MKKRITSIFLIMSLIVSMFAVSAVATSAASKLCVAPTIRSTINRIESLNVNWNSIQNATYYTLWVRSSFTGKWNGIKTKNGTTTYANYNWIRPGEKVDLKVSAVDKNGIHSEYSEIKTVENTSNVASKLATPVLNDVRNVGPLGRELTWSAVKGAKWYRVFYKNANGKWLSKYTTTQTRFYDTYPTAKGDTYTVACVTDNSANWYPLSGYDPVGKSKTAKCQSYDEWAVGKVIKIAGANTNAQTSGAESEAKFYKDLKDNEYNFNIPNGTAIRVAGVEYIGNDHTSANGRFKINYLNRYVGYVKMNYCLIDVGEYIPSATIALSFAAKDNSYVNKYNHTKSSIGVDEVVNMFNYNNKYVPGISNYEGYNHNRAWARYDVTKKLLLAQVNCLRAGFSLKIYDAYRPYKDTANVRASWKNYVDNHSEAYIGQIANKSIHNIGAAFDVSLIYEQVGVEAIMPTKMHDLSNNAKEGNWLGDTSYKGEHARKLRSLLTSADFDTYFGEWWHFQDNGVRDSLDKVYYNCGN